MASVRRLTAILAADVPGYLGQLVADVLFLLRETAFMAQREGQGEVVA
jgi:hypothetical protein